MYCIHISNFVKKGTLLSKLAVHFCYFGCVKCGFHFDSKLKNKLKKFFKGRVGCQKTFEIELREMDGR